MKHCCHHLLAQIIVYLVSASSSLNFATVALISFLLRTTAIFLEGESGANATSTFISSKKDKFYRNTVNFSHLKHFCTPSPVDHGNRSYGSYHVQISLLDQFEEILSRLGSFLSSCVWGSSPAALPKTLSRLHSLELLFPYLLVSPHRTAAVISRISREKQRFHKLIHGFD